jgi:hypothetical protein
MITALEVAAYAPADFKSHIAVGKYPLAQQSMKAVSSAWKGATGH